jgi:hypothetical protein
MNKHPLAPAGAVALAVALLAAAAQTARADVVTDWNQQANTLVADAKLGPPPAYRVMALVQTAVHDAVRAALALPQGGDVAVAAAVAAANRATLARLLPAQEAAVAAAFQKALAALPDGAARAAGLAAGEQAAAALLARRADDGAAAPERYRPHAAPGAYVPTAGVAAVAWAGRKPWRLDSPAQFRPAAPAALDSAAWARDYQEVQALGARASRQRSAEQTEVARFWEFSLPSIYHGLLRGVAERPGRGVAQNAQLYAVAGQAMDDALIAVFDAKYHHGFWRPVTAIRNGDRDGHPATELEPGWLPLVDTPMHPEYPSAHSALAGALAEVLQAEGLHGAGLATSSPTLPGRTRRWASLDAFVQEVGDARVWGGIHFRQSAEAGAALGRRVGALAVQPAQAAAPVPDAIAPRGAHRLVERIGARGVQVYECRADAAAPGGAQWVFVAPQAELFGTDGSPRGRHYEGPHWEAEDGSRIVGRVQARADAPRPGDIPWLLLAAQPVGGPGRFAQVSQVQRVDTEGGGAPAQACTPAAAGAVARVPYRADYLLYAS